MTQQPGARAGFAEAGHPVGVPGVPQQQPRRPDEQQSEQAGPDRLQDQVGFCPQQNRSEGSEEHPESEGLSPAAAEKPFMWKEFQHTELL